MIEFIVSRAKQEGCKKSQYVQALILQDMKTFGLTVGPKTGQMPTKTTENTNNTPETSVKR